MTGTLAGVTQGTQAERIPAGLGRRLGGIAIDWAASYVIAVAIYGFGADGVGLTTLLIFAFETIALTWLITGSFGNTIVGVQILSVSGARLPLWRIALRTLLLCLVIPAVVMDSSGRGWHDRAAGSQAFRRPRRSLG